MPAPQACHVRLTQEFQAPLEQVFDAWLDPISLGCWMFGPQVRNEQVVRLTVDPRPHGVYSFVVNRQGTEIDHVGEYTELVRPHRLCFTWGVAGPSAVSSLVRVDFSSTLTGTLVSLVHELHPDWSDFRDRTAQAWSKMLAALGVFLQGSRPERSSPTL